MLGCFGTTFGCFGVWGVLGVWRFCGVWVFFRVLGVTVKRLRV